MINLAVKKHEETAKIARIRRLTKAVTTVVLAGYVVAAGGLVGWRWWVNTNETRVNAQLETLLAQVAGRASQEAVVRKLAFRTMVVREWLSGREGMGPEADFLAGAPMVPVAWDYDAGKGQQTVVVNATQVEQIDEMVTTISGRYQNVRVESVVWNEGLGWTGTIIFGGKK